MHEENDVHSAPCRALKEAPVFPRCSIGLAPGGCIYVVSPYPVVICSVDRGAIVRQHVAFDWFARLVFVALHPETFRDGIAVVNNELVLVQVDVADFLGDMGLRVIPIELLVPRL